jgi:hypothetical protein
MDQTELNRLIDQASGDLLYVIREVTKRGVSENELDADDFEVLLLRKEFKELVVAELYEAYFLPERHESDWQVLRELVTIATFRRKNDGVSSLFSAASPEKICKNAHLAEA